MTPNLPHAPPKPNPVAHAIVRFGTQTFPLFHSCLPFLPRRASENRLDVNSHHFVEASSKLMADTSPQANLTQLEGCSAESRRIEILVCDGIPPLIQFFKRSE